MFKLFTRQIMRLNEKSVAAFATSQSPIDKEGHLQKKGEINKGYQRRWFVLKGNLLFYFERRGDKEPIGVIVLEKCSVGLCDGGDPYSFYIAFQGSGTRTYVLCANNETEMTAWIRAISHAGYDYLRMIVGELERRVAVIQRERGSALADPFHATEVEAKGGGGGGDGRRSTDRSSMSPPRLQPVPAPPIATATTSGAAFRSTSPTATYSSLARQLTTKNHAGFTRAQPSFVSHTAPRSEMSKATASAFPDRLSDSASATPAKRLIPRSFDEMHREFGVPIQKILMKQAEMRDLNQSFAQTGL
ncbi:sesquipedalian-1-like [Oscarella lobularis]|uniref:sesquipedalian-1-like n=1 Tax=Oscarella lobularis TaxID=121494 RepID=UPI0033130C86